MVAGVKEIKFLFIFHTQEKKVFFPGSVHKLVTRQQQEEKRRGYDEEKKRLRVCFKVDVLNFHSLHPLRSAASAAAALRVEKIILYFPPLHNLALAASMIFLFINIFVCWIHFIIVHTSTSAAVAVSSNNS